MPQLHVHRHDDRWDIEPSTVRIWDGNLTIKGTHSDVLTDLQLTGDDMSLQTASLTRDPAALLGRLNFSLTTRGPADNLQTTGSFWINNISWARDQAESIRGNLAISPSHFVLHGASEDEQIRLDLEGARNPRGFVLQQGLLQIRPDTTLNAHGTYNILNRIERVLGSRPKMCRWPTDIPLPASLQPMFCGVTRIFKVKSRAHSRSFF